MNFGTIERSSLISISKGNWKPMFKPIVPKNYGGEEYENILYQELFSQHNQDTIFVKNIYPINLGNNLERYVIWIRNQSNDIGIEKIEELISQKYPDMDYYIYSNLPELRTITHIIHYHTMIKNPSPPAYLEKLIVLVRHGNREPNFKLPAIEKILENSSLNYSSDAKLLPIGHQNSIKFGKDIKEIYQLNDLFTSNPILLTSPYTRCKETLLDICAGLDIQKKELIETEILGLTVRDNVIKFDDIDGEIDGLYLKYSHIIDHLDQIFEIKRKYSDKDLEDAKFRRLRLTQLYEVYSNVVCYREMGIDIGQFMSPKFEKEFNEATLIVFNTLYRYHQFLIPDQMEEIMKYVSNLDSNLVIGSTHDSFIFILVKYLSNKFGINFNYELPHYLSNIRIEQWSDGESRMYYNNWYLGPISKL